ncbi:hypothetical protein [Saccharicrinis aurantiacus]|uniref:hypothetical protein n=1 Tax=Saccharicrinis aurantiacus TaxID=1849719 RepID=UPI0024913AA8|nr:hypothetical protein [Saccharicrinis aurantiacus]
MDEDFMPGRPIIQIETFLETGIQKEIKLYGWLNAPIEIQVFLMDIMSRSLRANAK